MGAISDRARAAEAVEEPEVARIVVRDADSGEMQAVEATQEARDAARVAALDRKAVFEHRSTGAKTRAGALTEKGLTALLAGSATNLVLMQLVQQELVPATAKEAAEIARITHGIYVQAAGESKRNEQLTPEERTKKQDEAETLRKTLEERARAATEELGGALPEGEVPPPVEAPEAPAENEWEHDEA